MAFFGRGVQHLEKLGQMHTEIAAVLIGTLFEVILKQASLEKRGIFGEQAEQEPHQQYFQRMAVVAGRLELVVQFPQFFGGLHVDRVLLAEAAGLITGNEAEKPNMIGEFCQGKIVLFIVIQIMQAKAGEVGNQHVAREISLF